MRYVGSGPWAPSRFLPLRPRPPPVAPRGAQPGGGAGRHGVRALLSCFPTSSSHLPLAGEPGVLRPRPGKRPEAAGAGAFSTRPPPPPPLPRGSVPPAPRPGRAAAGPARGDGATWRPEPAAPGRRCRRIAVPVPVPVRGHRGPRGAPALRCARFPCCESASGVRAHARTPAFFRASPECPRHRHARLSEEGVA